MSCSFTEKISSLIDGELPAGEAREVERHLLTCGECEQARADFLSLRSQIANFETALPTAVQNRALAKILSGGKRERTPAVRLGWGFAATAFAALIIVGLIIGFISNRQPEHVAVQSPPPAPSPEAKRSPSPETKEIKETKEQPRVAPKRKPAPVREPKPGEQFAVVPQRVDPTEPVRSADAQTMTAIHFEKSETLLRAFRNVRLNEPSTATEVGYERKRAQQLVYQNMMLRREADAAGDVEVASLLENLEPILLDIANLPDRPNEEMVRAIRARVERKNIVALLQVNSAALARALD
jgi:putative zinc finger protein